MSINKMNAQPLFQQPTSRTSPSRFEQVLSVIPDVVDAFDVKSLRCLAQVNKTTSQLVAQPFVWRNKVAQGLKVKSEGLPQFSADHEVHPELKKPCTDAEMYKKIYRGMKIERQSTNPAFLAKLGHSLSCSCPELEDVREARNTYKNFYHSAFPTTSRIGQQIQKRDTYRKELPRIVDYPEDFVRFPRHCFLAWGFTLFLLFSDKTSEESTSSDTGQKGLSTTAWYFTSMVSHLLAWKISSDVRRMKAEFTAFHRAINKDQNVASLESLALHVLKNTEAERAVRKSLTPAERIDFVEGEISKLKIIPEITYEVVAI